MAFSGAIGIDLGTTYSCVGVFKNDAVEIIANDQGNRTTPSYVAFTDTERLVGDAAKNQVAMNPENTIFDAKRLIGRKFDDPDVQKDMKHWPFKVICQDGKPLVQVMYMKEKRCFAPEEISAMVLGKMKETAESYMGQEIQKAVVTVPAYFNDSQRQATKDAGTIAGLDVLRIINEPTAAAMAYGLDRKDERGEKTVLIFDLGGGTFDVTLLTMEEGVFEVKATAGDTHLGGEDFDNLFVDFMAQQFKTKYNKDVTTSAKALRRLRTACERAKRNLSSATSANIEIDGLMDGIDFTQTVTRARFEDLCRDLFQKCREPVKRVLDDSGVPPKKVDEVILVGGSTRIPKVQEIVSDIFKKKELNKSVNPDEAVAYGAAVQAHILSGGKSKKTEGLLLLDVTPLSLGVETVGGVMSTIIPRNTQVPVTKTQTFSNNADNQKSVDIVVYEGERPLVSQCRKLGMFRLENLPQVPRGKARITVSFDVNTDGILVVSAVEESKGDKKSITITNDKGRLSKQEIERMVEEANKFKEEDEKNAARIEQRNSLENLIFSLKNTVNEPDVAQHMDANDRQAVTAAANEAQAWMDAASPETAGDDYFKRIQELERKTHPLLAKFYDARAAAQNAADAANASSQGAPGGSAEQPAEDV